MLNPAGVTLVQVVSSSNCSSYFGRPAVFNMQLGNDEEKTGCLKVLVCDLIDTQ